MAKNRILLVGAGNVAHSMGAAIVASGAELVGVLSRSEGSAAALGKMLGVQYGCDISTMPDADVVIVAVSDAALADVAKSVVKRYGDALLLHTAGSVPMDIWRDAGAKHYGVLYPMQTFSRTRIVPFSSVTVFVEGCDDDATATAEAIAVQFGAKVHRATSQQRGALHLAAVFACNFVNASYAMAAEITEKYNLPFEALLPLIDETAAKVHNVPPRMAQTGPARRGDENVMDKHRSMLSGDMLEVYNLISKYIIEKR